MHLVELFQTLVNNVKAKVRKDGAEFGSIEGKAILEAVAEFVHEHLVNAEQSSNPILAAGAEVIDAAVKAGVDKATQELTTLVTQLQDQVAKLAEQVLAATQAAATQTTAQPDVAATAGDQTKTK